MQWFIDISPPHPQSGILASIIPTKPILATGSKRGVLRGMRALSTRQYREIAEEIRRLISEHRFDRHFHLAGSEFNSWRRRPARIIRPRAAHEYTNPDQIQNDREAKAQKDMSDGARAVDCRC